MLQFLGQKDQSNFPSWKRNRKKCLQLFKRLKLTQNEIQAGMKQVPCKHDISNIYIYIYIDHQMKLSFMTRTFFSLSLSLSNIFCQSQQWLATLKPHSSSIGTLNHLGHSQTQWRSKWKLLFLSKQIKICGFFLPTVHAFVLFDWKIIDEKELFAPLLFSSW